jgi:hypothetical protein
MNPNTSFHIEEQVPNDFTYFTLFFNDLEDTNLSISFVDDNSLLYSIDIALYEPMSQGSAFTILYEFWSHSFMAKTRIRSLNVTLGTAIPYILGVWGSNLNSSIKYDNEAVCSGVGAEFTYEASGTLLFTLTENVIMNTDFIFSAQSSSASPFILYLDIDLQDDVEGELQIGSTNITFVERVGWTWDGVDSYDTAAGSSSLQIVVTRCTHIVANLLD